MTLGRWLLLAILAVDPGCDRRSDEPTPTPTRATKDGWVAWDGRLGVQVDFPGKPIVNDDKAQNKEVRSRNTDAFLNGPHGTYKLKLFTLEHISEPATPAPEWPGPPYDTTVAKAWLEESLNYVAKHPSLRFEPITRDGHDGYAMSFEGTRSVYGGGTADVHGRGVAFQGKDWGVLLLAYDDGEEPTDAADFLSSLHFRREEAPEDPPSRGCR